MEFRILGALEVWAGGKRVEISGRLHPRILAGLLLNAGRTVSIEWLVDLLWDDDPPKTARRQVQNAVAALRRQLDPVREGLIERIGSDYRINIADDELDLRRFDKAVREARRLAEAGRWNESAAQFTSALDLWRTAALTGLSGRVLEASAARLDDKYLSTFEEYAHVAMAAGEASNIAGKLEELVAAHPFRQRLTARLMEALFRIGQTQEALALFDKVRDRLVDELGIDPGSELNSLRVRIVQDDIADAGNSKQLRPAQLPTDVATFTGRADQLAALDLLLDNGAQTGVVSAIMGIGGVGKTALVVHWGHMRREEFPDGQLYINLRGFDEREPLTPYEALSRLLRSLGHPTNSVPNDLDTAAKLYRSLLADKRMLVVLDNARAEEQIQPLLPNGPGSLAVITSRNRLSSLVAQSINLDTLMPDETLDLLVELLGPDALADITITRRIGQLCGHLPLALRIVAANCVHSPEKSLARLMLDLGESSRLSRLAIDGDTATSLSTVFDLSYHALSNHARHVFNHLGLVPGDDFSPALVTAIAKLDFKIVQKSFQELCDAHLMNQRHGDRYYFHDLIRAYSQNIAGRSIPQAGRDSAIHSLIDWYGDEKNIRHEELSNVLAVCDAFPSHKQLWKLINSFKRQASNGTDMDVLVRYARRALREAENLHADDARINILTTLGGILGAAGDCETGIEKCNLAQQLLSPSHNGELHGNVFGQLGYLHYTNGSYTEAEQYLNHALVFAKQSANKRRLVTRSLNLGNVYRALGRYIEAEQILRSAQISAVAHDLREMLAGTLVPLSNLYNDMGHYDESQATAHHALEVAREINASRLSSLAMDSIGHNLRKLLQYQDASNNFETALEIARRENRITLQVQIIQGLAETNIDAGSLDKAESNLATSSVLIDLGRPKATQVADQARLQCRIHAVMGNFATAIEHGTHSLAVRRERGQNPLYFARSLDALGDAHLGNNDPTKAHETWTEALAIATRLNVPEAATLRAKLSSLPSPR